MAHDVPHKAGFVNIIGNPNVGKSTLMNLWVGERLSIITSKAQTTRHRILGIVNGKDYQICFHDTPGIIKPAYALQESMMDFVNAAIEDADILVYLVEWGESTSKEEEFFKKIVQARVPVLVLINKIDLGNQEELEQQIKHWQEKIPQAEVYPISAKNNFGVQQVYNRIVELLPESPPYFPKDTLTDKSERFFVNETIREKILKHYREEIPYSVEVETESFKEKDDIIHIHSVIMVERESQKGIIIGHKGKGIQRIGTEARKDLEVFFDKKIFLKLFVKVNKDWRTDTGQLKRFGYKE